MITIPHRNNIAFITKSLVSLGFVATSIVATIYIIRSGIAPAKYLYGGIAALLLVNGLCIFLLFKTFSKRAWLARLIAAVIITAAVAAMAMGYTALSAVLNTVDKITSHGDSVKVETSKAFNIFISGIDTYGDISTVSRSDVNIVATVNPDTKHMLLTTIPRDSYVRIALGGHDQYDKLTHAGNYGVLSSVKTVSNLLNTPIDAYVRINFSSFILGIDKVGGITVSNPTAFESYGEKFAAGDIFLDGKRALVFARERKSLTGGDVDRGKNQQRVIEGFLNKVAASKSIDQYNALLSTIGGSVDTNMSSESLRALINQQLERGGKWTTSTQILAGKGQTGGLSSYAMPSSQLYMYVLDKESLASAQSAIATQLQNK